MEIANQDRNQMQIFGMIHKGTSMFAARDLEDRTRAATTSPSRPLQAQLRLMLTRHAVYTRRHSQFLPHIPIAVHEQAR